MDDRQFDRWTQALAERLSRRGLERLGAGALVVLSAGAAPGLSRLESAEAKKKRGKKKKRKKRPLSAVQACATDVKGCPDAEFSQCCPESLNSQGGAGICCRAGATCCERHCCSPSATCCPSASRPQGCCSDPQFPTCCPDAISSDGTTGLCCGPNRQCCEAGCCPAGATCCPSASLPGGCCSDPQFPTCCPESINALGTLGVCAPAGSVCCVKGACPSGTHCCTDTAGEARCCPNAGLATRGRGEGPQLTPTQAYSAGTTTDSTRPESANQER